MYNYVPREQIADSLTHLRELFREISPASEEDRRAQERREILTRNLLSNLFRTKEHPTLHSVLEVADAFSLTLDGAHRLFGYDLESIREYDFRLNAGRTHIIETYPFERDRLVDLPFRFGDDESFARDAAAHDLVLDWHANVPIRHLESTVWQQPNAFYVRVGTEDSLGSSLPPGSLALVVPVDEPERLRPNPRVIYLLQFGNGYRCSRCVVTRGKLILLTSSRRYDGPQEFAYPSGVRIAGRVRMFSLSLPVPDYPSLSSLPSQQQAAPLILPWEHRSMDRILWTKHRRFRRQRHELLGIRETMEEVFRSGLSSRTERRYRRPTSSLPHVDTLIQLTVSHAARYTDILRVQRPTLTDRGKYSLETLLNARHLHDLPRTHRRLHFPMPQDRWTQLCSEFVEWPAQLSVNHPRLGSIDERIVRLQKGIAIQGLYPPIGPGSLLLLEKPLDLPEPKSDAPRGWARRLYAMWKGSDLLCGHLAREGNQHALLTGSHESGATVFLRREDLEQLRRVCAVAVPV